MKLNLIKFNSLLIKWKAEYGSVVPQKAAKTHPMRARWWHHSSKQHSKCWLKSKLKPSSLTQWCQLYKKVWLQRRFMGHAPLCMNQAARSLRETCRAICSKVMTTRIDPALLTRWTTWLARRSTSSVAMQWSSVDIVGPLTRHYQPLPRNKASKRTQSCHLWPQANRFWK